ncbi:unnamed protein product [Meloidogyne enterolobii]|uniref:Uncharacterized protein n=1 Tax=Meloidogyne enterolobii TaxID=390850 RepID=A0ACB0Y8L1_MELEN
MAHGLSFNEKDSEHFGEDDFNVNFGSENNLNKEKEEIGNKQNIEGNLELKIEEEDDEDGNEFKKRFGENPYLVKPLYDREGKMEEQNRKIFDVIFI